MDESAITGESEMINKIPIIENEDKPTNLTPFLISGSKVMEGSGKVNFKYIFDFYFIIYFYNKFYNKFYSIYYIKFIIYLFYIDVSLYSW